MNTSNRFRGIASVRADATALGLVTQIQAAFEAFKVANDTRIAALETGRADVLNEEKVNTINAHITTLQGQLAEVAAQAAFRGGSSAGDDALAKAALAFGTQIGAPQMSTEDYTGYRRAMDGYLRSGEARLPLDAKAALSVGSDPNGGFLVTTEVGGRIVSRIYESSPMRQVANVITIGSDSIEGLIDNDQAGAGWVGETQARTETTTPEIGKWTIPVHELYAEPKATQKLLDDADVDIEAWLGRKVGDRFARVENAAFVNGDGMLKPRGLFTYTTATTEDDSRAWGTFQHINTGQSAGFAASNPGDALVDTVFSLKSDYRQNASWMMNRATLGAVRKLKDGDNNYLWQPNFQERTAGTLLGHAIVEAEDIADIGAASLSIAFGDFNEAYQIVDRRGMTVLRDPFTQKGFVKFYSTKRVGGGAINFEAVKFVRFGA
jgi:HK97 family phage major capsid protein